MSTVITVDAHELTCRLVACRYPTNMRTFCLLSLLASAGAFHVAPIISRERPRLTSFAAPLDVAKTAVVAKTPVARSSVQMSVTFPTCCGIATAACSLAFIRQAYVFSLSYGLAMAGIGAAVLAAIPGTAPAALTFHAYLVLAYGVRLFAFLFWRQVGQDAGWGARLARLDKTPRAKRAPVVVSTALFYAMMASPLLFHLQSAPLPFPLVTTLGCVVAAVGLLIETVADQSKSLFKIQLRASGEADRPYTGGVWAYSRHANYLGEILFWVGATVAGVPSVLAPGLSLLTRLLRTVSMGLGLSGIVFIMLSATKRLEKKQADSAASVWPVLRDGELDSYEAYVARSGKLLPF